MENLKPILQSSEFLGGLWAAVFIYLFSIFAFLLKSLYERRTQSRLNHIYLEHCAVRFFDTLDGSLVELKALKERISMNPRHQYFAHLSMAHIDESYSLRPMRGAFIESVFHFELGIKDYNALVEVTNESLSLFKKKWADSSWPSEAFISDFLTAVGKTIEHLEKNRTKAIQFLAKARTLARRTITWRILPVNLRSGWPYLGWSSPTYTEKERILFKVVEGDIESSLST